MDGVWYDAAEAGDTEVLDGYLERAAVRCADHKQFRTLVSGREGAGRGRVALVSAVRGRHEAAVEVLLGAGCCPTDTDGAGDTPLLAALGHHSLTQRLLWAGGDWRDPTVLCRTAELGLTDLLEDLVGSRGVDIRVRHPVTGLMARQYVPPSLPVLSSYLERHEHLKEISNFLAWQNRWEGVDDRVKLPGSLQRTVASFVLYLPPAPDRDASDEEVLP